jgi:two-component system sensor histidine kinase DegS
MTPTTGNLAPADRFAAIEAETRRELDQSREQLSEIQLLLQQSANEADKLAQREGAITSRVRDMEINLENYSRSDVKALYTSAHEVGLRLFMMRSQVEQLQMRHEHIKERQAQLGLILSLLQSGLSAPAPAPATPAAAAPMPLLPGGAHDLTAMIEAQESERMRVSRYLHDGPAQSLTNLVLRAEICEHLIDRDPAEARAELQGLRANLTNSLQETRRLIFDLRPMTLDDIGLCATLRRYLTDVGRAGGFAHTVTGLDGGDELSTPMRSLLFRLIQDIVSGLQARIRLEHVSVNIGMDGSEIEVMIAARAAEDEMPPLADVLTLEPVGQRLAMLVATSDVSQVGTRTSQVVVQAVLPTAA